ncbi:Ltp family lipoprotein [Leucobacter sp. cx-328]|nr:Ltp family lipoprotein [Leucobacter sp. cx-328]
MGVGAAVNVLAESPAIQSPELVTPEPVIPENDTEAPSDTPAPAPTDVPVEFTSALTKADLYANTMHMSKAGLYDQLTSEYGEQFSAEAGQYAVDNVKTDWNRNALEKAKEYQDLMAMSPNAIRDQLVSEYGEQFTAEEADYALANLNS